MTANFHVTRECSYREIEIMAQYGERQRDEERGEKVKHQPENSVVTKYGYTDTTVLRDRRF